MCSRCCVTLCVLCHVFSFYQYNRTLAGTLRRVTDNMYGTRQQRHNSLRQEQAIVTVVSDHQQQPAQHSASAQCNGEMGVTFGACVWAQQGGTDRQRVRRMLTPQSLARTHCLGCLCTRNGCNHRVHTRHSNISISASAIAINNSISTTESVCCLTV